MHAFRYVLSLVALVAATLSAVQASPVPVSTALLLRRLPALPPRPSTLGARPPEICPCPSV
ncbi:hypothetical protein GY45DRAFT_1325548 [Cubamyces sp. BRFM 1775]|nr:hypothetical protein GY45DRAFT_1325548 [Cubamyces sp. BRFM 1775]